jgi:hypothetical protein
LARLVSWTVIVSSKHTLTGFDLLVASREERLRLGGCEETGLTAAGMVCPQVGQRMRHDEHRIDPPNVEGDDKSANFLNFFVFFNN